MSKQVDERVVSMQFDNRHFEKNVQTTMSTLDKLKQKLHLDGAAKGLDNVSTAAKKVDMSGLSSGIETVRTKFSALEVMGVTALANITNSAVNAGKRIISALTIEPVKTGLQEYETQINAVQTIMANVAHKGKTLDDVNNALDELNKYADQTIYNFTEMTKNIGLFTNAGVGLDESVASIKGFSNAAAMAGTDSTKASLAMYQLSQAMSAGSVKLLDWKSLETANITGERFVDTIKETAKAHGIAVDDMIAKEGNFRETLKSGWLTADLMAEALNHYTLSTETMTEAEQEAAKAKMRSNGYTEEQIDKLFKLGTEATNAATKVKTFSQMWGVIQESLQSGWAKTWQIIFGDFEEAKALFTPLTKFFTGIIDKISDARNKLLEGALGNPFKGFLDKINNSGLGKTVEKVSNLSKGLEYYQKVVNDVWRGDYKNQPYRYDLLDKAGYNHKVVQSLVNKGYQYKLTMEDVTEAEKKFGVAIQETSNEVKNTESAIGNLSDEQLKNAGLTDEEIKLYRELEKQSKKTGKSISELVAEMENKDGRTLLIESFKNAGQGLVKVITAIKEAWVDIFPPMTSIQLYNIIKGINEFSTHLRMGDETAGKLKRTLKGLFAILDIVLTVVGGPIKIVFKILTQLLAAFDLNILDVTAAIGDAIVRFRDWIDSTLDFTKIFEKIVPVVKNAIKTVKEWVSAIKDSEFYKTGKNILQGLINGLKNGAQNVWEAIVNIGKTIVEKIKGVLGIHSPSTVFFEIGSNIIQGLVNGIQNGASKVWEAIKTVASKCVEFLKNVDWGAVFSGGAIVGTLVIANKLANALSALASPFEGLGGIFGAVTETLYKSQNKIKKILNNTAKVVKSFSKVLNSFAFSIKAKALKDIAIALGILVLAIIALTFVDPKKLWQAVAIVAALSAILVALAFATEKMAKASITIGKNGAQANGLKSSLLSVAAALLLLAFTVKIIGNMDPEKAKQGFLGLAGMVVAIGVLCLAYAKLAKGNLVRGIDRAGRTLFKISAAMLMMALVIKVVSGMDAASLFKGIVVITAFGLIITGLMAATKLAGKDIGKVGSTILAVSGAMMLMALVVRLVAGMNVFDLVKGLAVISAFASIISGLILVTKLAGKDIAKIGSTIFAISGAMLMMVFVMRLISGMDITSLAKGITVITIFSVIISGLIASTRLAGGNLKGVASTILMVSVSIGILALVATLLGFLSLKHLAKGITAVGILSTMMAMMIKSLKGAQNVMGSLIVMTVAIGVMAAAVAALSFIEPSRLASATAALSAVIGMFALLIKSTKSIKGAKSLIGPMLVMLGVVSVLSGIVIALSYLASDKALQNTAALSLLLLSMSASLLILSKSGKVSKSALGALAVIGLVVGELAIILGAMSALKLEGSVATATALTILLAAMTGVLVVLSLIGDKANKAYTGIGALAVLGIVVAELAVILGFMSKFDINPSIEFAKSLSILLVSMSAALILLGVVGLIGPVAFLGIAVLIGFIAAMGAFIIGVGYLMEEFPKLEEFLNKGIPILEKLANGIGSILGNLIKGFSTAVASALPEIGTYLSQFMENASGFVEGIKKVDESTVSKVGSLVAAILALTAAQLVNGIVSFIPWSSSFAQMGTDLSSFMKNASGFIEGAKNITPESMTGVKSLAETILILTAADVLNGIASWIGGGSSLENFGTELGYLGTGLSNFAEELNGFDDSKLETVNRAASAIKTLAEASAAIPNAGGLLASIVGDNDLGTFAAQFPILGIGLSKFLENVGTFNEEQVATVKCAADAIKALATASKEIPNTGGLLGAIVGENDLGTFAAQFPILGYGLAQFLVNVGTFTEEQVATVKCAADAIKTLASASKEIPNTGGWLGAIVGENDLGIFAAQFPILGAGLAGFLTNIGTFTEDQVSTVSCAANAIKTLASASKEVPNTGGLLGAIVGNNDLGTFSSQFPLVGAGIKGFADELGTFDSDKLATINCGIRAVNAISKLGKLNLEEASNNVKGFGKQLVKFGENLATFCNKISEVGTDSIKTAISNVNDLAEMIKGLSSINSDAAKSFGDSLKSLGESGIKKFVDAVSGEGAKGKVKDGAKKLIDAYINAIKGKNKDAENAFKGMVSKSLSGIKTKGNYDDFKSAGKYLGSGLVEGINAKQQAAYDAGYALGQKAVQGEKDGQQSESPSKLTIKAGKWLGEGLVIGMQRMGNQVYKSGRNLGETATDTISSAISKVADFVNTDIDAQPTIRPVLDLSDVSSGARAIDGMFSMQPSVGVLSNVRSISSMMNRGQNGTNNDVISAIKDLKSSFNNTPSNVYNVNGVTYDDGSNISDAVKTLVRAAKVERRS